MSKQVDRVRLNEIEWQSVLPWLRLFRCFRCAIHPSKLFTAWLLIVLISAVASLLSSFDSNVQRGEIEQYRQLHHGFISNADYDQWRSNAPAVIRDNVKAKLRPLTADGALPADLMEIGRAHV